MHLTKLLWFALLRFSIIWTDPNNFFLNFFFIYLVFLLGGFQVLSSLSPCRHVPSVFPSQFSHIVLERVPGDWDIKRFMIAKFAGLEIKTKMDPII